MTTMNHSSSEQRPSTGTSASGGVRTRSNIEVVIPCFNEEINLPFALRSVCEWADAVYVVDSESTDRTREVAESFGAKVVVQKWLGYAQQKNWALTNLPLSSDWTFILDADEAITPELKAEMLAIAARRPDEVHESGYYVNRLTYFLAKPIRHCGYFPSYNLRFFKRGKAHYEQREVHEHMIVDGPTDRLREIMLHEDRRGLEHFIAKHNRYSTLEARELLREAEMPPSPDPAAKERGIKVRRWLKRNVQPRLPLSAFWRFLYMYFLRLGILDGVTGLRFCLLLASYDLFISLKLTEARQAAAVTGKATIKSIGGLAQAEGVPVPTPTATQGVTAPVAAAAPMALVEAMKPAVVETPVAKPVAAAVPAAAGAPAPKTASPHAAIIPVRSPRTAGIGWTQFGVEDAKGLAHLPVSVIILTYNEELNIEGVLDSCSWCDDVHVLDSGSTDRTREIVQARGVPLWTNPFKSFGQQRNWAIDHIPTKHRWQFQLDADERFTPELIQELLKLLGSPEAPENQGQGVACYRCPSKLIFMDRWIRHAGEYPVYQVRLFDKTRCRFDDYGHGQREVVDGPTGVLETPYLHHNFSKGIDEWIQKHNRYSTLEAFQAIDDRPVAIRHSIKQLFSMDPVKRRRAMKALGYRLPARSSLMLFYMLVVRAGVLDGSSGYNYARLRGLYESMISLKHAALQHERRLQGKGEKAGGS